MGKRIFASKNSPSSFGPKQKRAQVTRVILGVNSKPRGRFSSIPELARWVSTKTLGQVSPRYVEDVLRSSKTLTSKTNKLIQNTNREPVTGKLKKSFVNGAILARRSITRRSIELKKIQGIIREIILRRLERVNSLVSTNELSRFPNQRALAIWVNRHPAKTEPQLPFGVIITTKNIEATLKKDRLLRNKTKPVLK